MYRRRTTVFRSLAAALVAAGSLSVSDLAAQEAPVAPLFASDDVVELVLEAPIRTLKNNRRSREELPGRVRYRTAPDTEVVLDVQVRNRGKSRLNLCAFPPLSLNFRRGQVAGTLFAEQNRLKLVTLCRNSGSYEQYLELERLLYRIYEQVSDYAYRVRPVIATYIDTERDNREERAPAFLIEHTNGLAARTGTEPREQVGRISVYDLEEETTAVLGLFHYMIGNTDWSAVDADVGEECCHNHDLLAQSGDSPPLIAVPYDFDQAGFVNTSYAAPNEALRIRRVTQRLYRGFCASNEHLPAAIERFNAARDAIFAVLDSERLSEDSRETAQEFLEDYYEIINDPDEVEDEILDDCRG